MKHLIFDQSSKVCGFSVFEGSLVEYGELRIDKPDKIPPLERLRTMYFLIKEKIHEINPDFITYEQCQFQSNYAAYQLLSQLQGLIMALCFERDLGFRIIEPTAWRSYVGIQNGNKKREQQKLAAIQKVKDLFGFEEIKEDEAEAILIGIWACDHIKEVGVK